MCGVEVVCSDAVVNVLNVVLNVLYLLLDASMDASMDALDALM